MLSSRNPSSKVFGADNQVTHRWTTQ